MLIAIGLITMKRAVSVVRTIHIQSTEIETLREKQMLAMHDMRPHIQKQRELLLEGRKQEEGTQEPVTRAKDASDPMGEGGKVVSVTKKPETVRDSQFSGFRGIVIGAILFFVFRAMGWDYGVWGGGAIFVLGFLIYINWIHEDRTRLTENGRAIEEELNGFREEVDGYLNDLNEVLTAIDERQELANKEIRTIVNDRPGLKYLIEDESYYPLTAKAPRSLDTAYSV